MFFVLNLRKYRFYILILITLLIILFIIKMQDKYVKHFIYPIEYQNLVEKYSDKYNIDPFLVYAVIKVESNFKNEAESHKAAKGLMQVTDQTGIWAAKKMGLKDFNVNQLFDPEINIHIGCWYLSFLKKEFKGDLVLTLASYNGGSGNVKKWLKDKRYSKSGEFLEEIPFKETREYVKKVIKNYDIYLKLYKD